jgi:hypothetical protein
MVVVRPEGLCQWKVQWHHRESKPRPSGLWCNASTNSSPHPRPLYMLNRRLRISDLAWTLRRREKSFAAAGRPARILVTTLTEISCPTIRLRTCCQEIPRILWNPKVQSLVHKSPPLDPKLCQMNPIHVPHESTGILTTINCYGTIILIRCTVRLLLFCTMANKRKIISQIITLLHVSTLLCHLQGACNQYLAKLHKYFKCSCW